MDGWVEAPPSVPLRQRFKGLEQLKEPLYDFPSVLTRSHFVLSYEIVSLFPHKQSVITAAAPRSALACRKMKNVRVSALQQSVILSAAPPDTPRFLRRAPIPQPPDIMRAMKNGCCAPPS